MPIRTITEHWTREINYGDGTTPAVVSWCWRGHPVFQWDTTEQTPEELTLYAADVGLPVAVLRDVLDMLVSGVGE